MIAVYFLLTIVTAAFLPGGYFLAPALLFALSIRVWAKQRRCA